MAALVFLMEGDAEDIHVLKAGARSFYAIKRIIQS